jgi:putative hydrolase of the HAD superfamily
MSAVTAVVCDFAGVLTEPLDDTYTRFCAKVGITKAQLVKAAGKVSQEAGLPDQAVLDLRRWTEDQWAGRLAAALAEDTGVELDLSSFGQRWWFPGRERNHEFLDYLARLHSTGVRMAMCTNNVVEWEPSWRAMIPETDELFETVVNSCEVGVRKPDAEIFDLTAKLLDLAPEQCVLIDDLIGNCEGARAAGWQAIQFTDTASVIGELDHLITMN